MKQNIDLTFCTQQQLDSFSSYFYSKNLHHTIFYKGSPNGRLSKIWHSEKKQTELKHCEVFFRKYFLQVINVGDDIIRPIFL